MFKQLTITSVMAAILGINGLQPSNSVEVVQVFPRVELLRAEISKEQLKSYYMHQLRQSSLKENEIEEGIDGLSKATTTEEAQSIYGKYVKIEIDRIQQKRDEEAKAKKAEKNAFRKKKLRKKRKLRRRSKNELQKRKLSNKHSHKLWNNLKLSNHTLIRR